MLKKSEFSQNADKVSQWLSQFFSELERLPVKSKVKPKEVYRQLPAQAPGSSEAIEDILTDLQQIILPGMTHWQHPNFHAYFPANSSQESVFAEYITSALGAQCMIWDTSPSAAELEQKVLEWLQVEMDIPKSWEGVIQDTASSATLVAILSARERLTGFRSNVEGVPNNLRVYCSIDTHSSIDKAVAIAGIGTRNLIKIPVDKRGRMRTEALEGQIASDLKTGYVPCCVIASIGTTSRVAIDPLDEIANVCLQHQLWLHVDAAFAGTAMLLPECRWICKGLRKADSLVFNPHKWMFTNFDCSAYYVKNVETLLRTFEVLPEYLKTSTRGQVNDYRDWGVPLGRRFRALKLWFVIRSFGMDGIRARLRKHIELTKYFCNCLLEDSRFTLMQEPLLSFSCFRLAPQGMSNREQLNRLNESLLKAINESGEAFLSHTKIEGQYTIRMLTAQTYVEQRHIDKVLSLIKEKADILLQ